MRNIAALFLAFITAGLTAGIPATSSAVDVGKPKALIHGSLDIPLSPDEFSKGASLGFGGGIGLGMYVSEKLMFSVMAEFSTFGADEDGLREVYGFDNEAVIGGETSLFYAWAAARFDPVELGYFRPYVLGGMGFHRFVPDDVQFDNTIIDRKAQNSFGVHAGAGLDVAFGSLINAFVDVAYIVGFTPDESNRMMPLRGGLMFDLSPDDTSK